MTATKITMKQAFLKSILKDISAAVKASAVYDLYKMTFIEVQNGAVKIWAQGPESSLLHVIRESEDFAIKHDSEVPLTVGLDSKAFESFVKSLPSGTLVMTITDKVELRCRNTVFTLRPKDDMEVNAPTLKIEQRKLNLNRFGDFVKGLHAIKNAISPNSERVCARGALIYCDDDNRLSFAAMDGGPFIACYTASLIDEDQDALEQSNFLAAGQENGILMPFSFVEYMTKQTEIKNISMGISGQGLFEAAFGLENSSVKFTTRILQEEFPSLGKLTQIFEEEGYNVIRLNAQSLLKIANRAKLVSDMWGKIGFKLDSGQGRLLAFSHDMARINQFNEWIGIEMVEDCDDEVDEQWFNIDTVINVLKGLEAMANLGDCDGAESFQDLSVCVKMYTINNNMQLIFYYDAADEETEESGNEEGQEEQQEAYEKEIRHRSYIISQYVPQSNDYETEEDEEDESPSLVKVERENDKINF